MQAGTAPNQQQEMEVKQVKIMNHLPLIDLTKACV